MKQQTSGFLLCSLLGQVLGARILAVLPLPAKSHHILFQAILRTLAENGHEVIAYTPYPMVEPVANFTNVDLQIKSIDDKMTPELLYRLMTWPPHKVSSHLMEVAFKIMENVFENEKILELINSTDKFDLVIVEAFYAQEAFLGFGHKFKAPVVNIHPFGAHTVASFAAGSPLNLVGVPDFPLPYSNDMSFIERFYNAFTKLSPLYTYYTDNVPYQQQVMTNAFKDPTMPTVWELMSNISLYLNNAHPYVNYPQPYTPNTVPLGGIHLEAGTGRKQLPADMKRFLDEAVDGVIYFSLGSVLPDQLLGKQFFLSFIKVFRGLPQRVLWKTNSEYPNLPPNVMTSKWLPQQEILAHPNVVLFLTHGGLFSQHEAVYAGVPVVCIPFFVDQPMNAKFYEAKEVGVRLLFDTISEETILSALQAVVKNPKYKKNMMELSSIFRDQHQPPAKRLIYWIDYVITHGGAHHLTPASARLRWYQLWLLDVAAALLVAAGATIAAVYFTVSRSLQLFRVLMCPLIGTVKKNN